MGTRAVTKTVSGDLDALLSAKANPLASPTLDDAYWIYDPLE
jgi:hypothetical protein